MTPLRCRHNDDDGDDDDGGDTYVDRNIKAKQVSVLFVLPVYGWGVINT